MKRFFTFAVAAALAAGLSSVSWSQTGGAGGAGGGTGTSSSAGAGAAGTAGTNGTAGTAGAAGTAGTVTGNTNAAAGVGANDVRTNTGTTGRLNARVNANAGLRNSAAGVNGNVDTLNGVSQTPFFSDPGARQQLNLNNTQYNALNRAYQNAYNRYNQAVNNLSPNLTEQQRALQLQQLQAQFNQSLSGTVNGTFNNPQTLSRYNQLNRQFMGFNAFNDPAIRQQLNLTPEQVRQLRTLSNNWRQQLQQFRRGAGNDLSTVDRSQWNQLWQQYSTQLNSVLTPEQQQMWVQQVGQPYMFSPNVYFGAPPPVSEQGQNSTVVDPTVPKYFPNAAAGGTTRQGTQPTGTQATTQGTTTQGTSAPATQGGTVR